MIGKKTHKVAVVAAGTELGPVEPVGPVEAVGYDGLVGWVEKAVEIVNFP